MNTLKHFTVHCPDRIFVKNSLLAIFLSLSFHVNAQEEITLVRCREMALENNKQIGVAERGKEKAGLQVKEYRANYLPRFSATGSYLYTNTKMKKTIEGNYLPTFVPDPATGQLVPNILTTIDGQPVFREYAYFPDMSLALELSGTYVAGIKAEQPIYMGGKITAAHKMAKIGVEIAGFNQQLTQAEVLAKTDEAYWMHVKAAELVKSALKYKEVVSELYRNVENAYTAGMKPQNDVLKVQVKLNEAELQLRQAENAVRLSRMNLCHMIGLPLTSEIALPGNFETASANITRGTDISSRPEYAMLDKQVELKNQEEKLVRSEYLPNIGVMASYNYGYGLKLNDDPLLDKTSLSAVLSVNIPLFHWGEGKNKTKATRMEKEIIQLQQADINEKMELELAQALNAYDEALLEVELTERSLAQAGENLRVSRDQYEAGMETLANYLEAQTVWQKASTDLINARASLRLNETNCLKASGKLVAGD